MNLKKMLKFDADDVSGMSAAIDRMLGMVESGAIKPGNADDAISELNNSGKLAGGGASDQQAASSEGGEEEEEEEEQQTEEGEQQQQAAPGSEEGEGSEEETAEEEQQDEMTLLKAQNAALMAQLEALASGSKQVDAEEQDPVEPQEQRPQEQPQQQQQQPQEPIKFINPDDFDPSEFMESPEGLNKLGNEIFNKTSENSILTAVKMIHQLVPQYVTLAIESEKFFTANPELAAVRGFTSQVFQEVSNKNPNKSIREKFDLTKQEAYKRLKLPGKQQPQKKEEAPRKPKFPQAKGNGASPRSVQSNEEKDRMQEGIERMLKAQGVPIA